MRLAARERATGVRRSVALEDVSLSLREAIVATEDERFYHNHGVDLIGIARAIPYDLGHLSLAEGASTITDQLAKLLYLNGSDHSPWRKLEDLALSLRISTRFTKEQILDAYLNTVYFGNGAYGIAEAAQTYFGRAPARLDLAQASLLAGLVQAPTAYDPFVHPLAARWRQVDVLRSLVRDGYAASGEAMRVLDRSLPLRHGRSLPPLRGVAVASQPAFALAPLALGLALITGAFAAMIALRLRPPSRSAVLVALRWVCALAILAGAVTATNGINAI
jgi:penicillin-binding protein 1A